ncbi:hypothetical protein [Burkholderia anthina]|uniref:hypothetical protein n=1 Tax=Burkholderia anthina TaxID=179879 RepID=UPI00158AFCA3|nr:hypothetical protein [Burkholderia anthina]
MSTSADIETLFSRDGGDAEHLQKIRAESEWARARWPLLNVIELHADPRRPHSHAASSHEVPDQLVGSAVGLRLACDAVTAASALPFAARPTRTFDALGDACVWPLPSAKAMFATDRSLDAHQTDDADRSSGILKKRVDQPAARVPSEPLVRLFDRLRADTTEAVPPARFPLWTGRP